MRAQASGQRARRADPAYDYDYDTITIRQYPDSPTHVSGPVNESDPASGPPRGVRGGPRGMGPVPLGRGWPA
eukprot:5932713-Prymnesium_polylepis.1